MNATKKTGLELLREPFPAHQISKLPKPTKKQTEELKADYRIGRKCPTCGGWHQPEVIHLDYVGHAALTDRLLDGDPNWNWEPLALDDGLPKFDKSGGLWIKLTVCGQTRLGYGHAADSSYKEIGSREKEVIGDALRNAAMRFGAALELWHKGDLHLDFTPEEQAMFQDYIAQGNFWNLYLMARTIGKEKVNALLDTFPDGKKTEMKKKARELLQQGTEKMQGIALDLQAVIDSDDEHGVQEIKDSLTEEVWGLVVNNLPPEHVTRLDGILKEAA